MRKISKKQAIVIMGFTGVRCCPFNDFANDAEARLGYPIWEHELHSLQPILREVYFYDFMSMMPEKWDNGDTS